MPRTTSAALDAELAKAITSVGYLVQVGFVATERWSNIGQVTWNALNWLDRPFNIEGLEFSADSALACRMTIANHDDVAGAKFRATTEHMYDIVITLYQFARGALGVLDVPVIASMVINTCTINPERVSLDLGELSTDAQFSPRRRIAPSDGFNFATPAGTVIPWGNEILTVESGNG